MSKLSQTNVLSYDKLERFIQVATIENKVDFNHHNKPSPGGNMLCISNTIAILYSCRSNLTLISSSDLLEFTKIRVW